jgi:hypothetical protein
MISVNSYDQINIFVITFIRVLLFSASDAQI